MKSKLIVIGMFAATVAGCSDAGTSGQKVGLANPASVNCEKLGGKLDIRSEAGGQVGYCKLPDGRICEEWALFRDNKCVPPANKS